jgi:xylulokinase
MEGSTYYARDVIERFEELGFPVSKIIATGGGSRSALWRKIKADTLGKPIVSPVSEDVSTIGAIVLAAVGVKLYKSVEDAVQKFVKFKEEVLMPDEKNLGTYTKLYKTYKKTYWALNDIFKEISQFQMGK